MTELSILSTAPDELWRPVVGFEGLYEVSNLGRVRSLDRCIVTKRGARKNLKGRILRPGPRPSGHLTVVIGGRTQNVHTLVLEAFVGPRPTRAHEGRHLDGNERDNRACRLEWSTKRRNMQDRKWHKGVGKVLTPARAAEIKASLATPYRGVVRDLALRHGVAVSTISAIRMGKFHLDV